MPRRKPVDIRPRIRISRGDLIVMGPGKADLLEQIRDTGSLREAATRLAMSYTRAWSLVQTMNAAFREPLVATVRGGASHGSATLTPHGIRVLELYRQMEAHAREAIEDPWRELQRALSND